MDYLVTSDIHLGHPNTPTQHIITSFKTHILTAENASLDVLFIAGDLFDRLLYLNTKEAQQCIAFIHDLLSYCYTYQITLIVLEGTPSHDWYQSNLIVKINDLREHKVHLYYHKSLEIQYLPEHQKHILFIPDEWCKDERDLQAQVNAKLQEHGITKVDIAILHGQFRYQLQGRPSNAFCYDEAYFLELTRDLIHIGHYHVHSQFDRIIAQGSLERLAHGEEAPKGYVLVKDGVSAFIENPDAYTYKTLPVTAKTTQARLDTQIRRCRPGSHIRLSMSPQSPFTAIFQELKVRYSDYHLKKLIKEPASETSSVTYITSDDTLELCDNLYLETNIYDALMQAITAKHTFSVSEHAKLLGYAEVFKTSTEGV